MPLSLSLLIENAVTIFSTLLVHSFRKENNSKGFVLFVQSEMNFRTAVTFYVPFDAWNRFHKRRNNSRRNDDGVATEQKDYDARLRKLN
jgi:hypothetical protein